MVETAPRSARPRLGSPATPPATPRATGKYLAPGSPGKLQRTGHRWTGLSPRSSACVNGLRKRQGSGHRNGRFCPPNMSGLGSWPAHGVPMSGDRISRSDRSGASGVPTRSRPDSRHGPPGALQSGASGPCRPHAQVQTHGAGRPGALRSRTSGSPVARSARSRPDSRHSPPGALQSRACGSRSTLKRRSPAGGRYSLANTVHTSPIARGEGERAKKCQRQRP